MTQQEDTIGVNFIQLAIQLYNFSNAKQIESESLNNEDGGNVWPNHMMLGALYQAVYSYNYSFVMKDKKDQAGWAYRNRHIELAADALGRVNTKAYWSKN
ncbi:MAG: hypothetical protein HWD59_09130 [Coxiellaceae bacterium]|nr:MAG: hypothetical protein HWD59_09130 [Coxiellaceae bacterium]